MRPVVCLLLGLLVALSAQSVFAQHRAVAAADTTASPHKRAYLRAAQRLGFRNPALLNQYYQYQIDVTKTPELRRLGLDLLRRDSVLRIDGQEDYLDGILYADVIVLATVLSRRDDPRREVWFHSAFTVQVTEVWQGELRTDTLTVRQASGPVGLDGLSASIYGEPRLQIGQQVLLYLNPMTRLAPKPDQPAEAWPYVVNFYPTDYHALAAYPVAGDKVYRVVELAASRKLSSTRHEIQRVIAVLDKAHFAQRRFE